MSEAETGDAAVGLYALVSRVDELVGALASIAAELASAAASGARQSDAISAASTELIRALLAVRPHLKIARDVLAAGEISG